MKKRKREREREREKDRQNERERDREAEKEGQNQKERERERENPARIQTESSCSESCWNAPQQNATSGVQNEVKVWKRPVCMRKV